METLLSFSATSHRPWSQGCYCATGRNKTLWGHFRVEVSHWLIAALAGYRVPLTVNPSPSSTASFPTFYCQAPPNHHVLLTITRLPTIACDFWLALLFTLHGSLLLHLSLADSSSCFRAHLQRFLFWALTPQTTVNALPARSHLSYCAQRNFSLSDCPRWMTHPPAFSLHFAHFCFAGSPVEGLLKCFTTWRNKTAEIASAGLGQTTSLRPQFHRLCDVGLSRGAFKVASQLQFYRLFWVLAERYRWTRIFCVRTEAVCRK